MISVGSRRFNVVKIKIMMTVNINENNGKREKDNAINQRRRK